MMSTRIGVLEGAVKNQKEEIDRLTSALARMEGALKAIRITSTLTKDQCDGCLINKIDVEKALEALDETPGARGERECLCDYQVRHCPKHPDKRSII